jgi:hypothetical protein
MWMLILILVDVQLLESERGYLKEAMVFKMMESCILLDVYEGVFVCAVNDSFKLIQGLKSKAQINSPVPL